MNRYLARLNCHKHFELQLSRKKLYVNLGLVLNKDFNGASYCRKGNVLDAERLNMKFENVRRWLLFHSPHKKGQGPIIKFAVETIFFCLHFFNGRFRKLKFGLIVRFWRLFLWFWFLGWVAFLNNWLAEVFLWINIVTYCWTSYFFSARSRRKGAVELEPVFQKLLWRLWTQFLNYCFSRYIWVI